MTDQNTTSMSQPTSSTFKVGDRVRIEDHVDQRYEGRTGTVAHVGTRTCVVHLDPSGRNGWVSTSFMFNELVLVSRHEQLIALAEALGAVEFNRWVADGMLCRRYITSDGSIDLTVRVQ